MKVIITRLDFEYSQINVQSMADSAADISHTTVGYMLLAGDWKYENAITFEIPICDIDDAIIKVLEHHKLYI
jgi:hypothetical protein